LCIASQQTSCAAVNVFFAFAEPYHYE
jgi:hypothetical protein